MNLVVHERLFPVEQQRTDVLDCFVFLVRPELARRLLVSHRVNDRPIDVISVARFADDMRAGRWRLNGEPIVFDDKERLVDGRRRLAAIVRADVAVSLLVVRGVDPTTATTLDQAQPRTPVEALIHEDLDCAETLAPALELLAHYRDADSTSTEALSTPRLLQTHAREPGLHESVQLLAGQELGGWPVSLATLAVAHHLTSQISSAGATDFFLGLQSGAARGPESPFTALRHRLARDHVTDGEALLILLGTWVAWFGQRELGLDEDDVSDIDDEPLTASSHD